MSAVAPAGFTSEQTCEFALLWSSAASGGWTRRSDRAAVRVLAVLRAQQRVTAAQRAQRRRLEVQLGIYAPGAEVELLLEEQDWLARREVARRAGEDPAAGRVQDARSEGART